MEFSGTKGGLTYVKINKTELIIPKVRPREKFVGLALSGIIRRRHNRLAKE